MEKKYLEQIEGVFDELDINADYNVLLKMEIYTNALIKGMEKSRLTGERTKERIIKKQLYDSLIALKYVNLKKASSLIDLGTGGGLPGVPIKIVRPDLVITLLDSNRKKTLFLKDTIKILGLEKINVVNKRAEEIGQEAEHREKYNYIFSRAVAKMSVLAELALPLLTLGGEAIFYKGPRGDDEFKTAEGAIETCGGALKYVKSYDLKNGESRKLYVIKKIKATPGKYPRKSGKPGKNPINE